MYHATPVACAIGDGGFYPHRPARLLIKMKARVAMVRQLKVPVVFSAVLPHGPLPKPKQLVCDGGCMDRDTSDGAHHVRNFR